MPTGQRERRHGGDQLIFYDFSERIAGLMFELTIIFLWGGFFIRTFFFFISVKYLYFLLCYVKPYNLHKHVKLDHKFSKLDHKLL